MKLYGKVGSTPPVNRNRLDVSGDLDSVVDPGSFYRILYR